MPVTNTNTRAKRHLVVVEAYDGLLERLSNDPGERAAMAGLGLPLAELAERLECRITLLDWRAWLKYERQPGTFPQWMPFPCTRPVDASGLDTSLHSEGSPYLSRVSIAIDDPATRRSFHEGLSPCSYGLLANSDPLFLASYVLNQQLEALPGNDPISAIILPMWGGAGYVAQMSRATGVGLGAVPIAVVATDTSKSRHAANGEGLWTRPAITRRQMEDLSLALADLVICYGPRGEKIARNGNPASPVVIAPRYVQSAALDAIQAQAPSVPRTSMQFFIDEPLEPASGTMMMLDAVNALRHRGIQLGAPVACSGPAMRFAPMKPRDFQGYWSSRGWVRELVDEGRWEWRDDRPSIETERLAARVYPSLFEHLPAIWNELGRGSFVILSPAAVEGLALGQPLPPEAVLAAEPTAESLADHIARLHQLGSDAIERARGSLCAAVARAHQGAERSRLLDETATALSDLLAGTLQRPALDGAAQLLLDRRKPLAGIARVEPRHDSIEDTLTVVVVCYEMGALLAETVESVWRSRRLPDELILVDDGSHGSETLAAIQELETQAKQRGLAFQLLRQNNRGLANARNAGLAAATGRYISFIDGDDLIAPEFYGLALDILRANPALGGVAAWAVLFGDGVPDGFWNAPQPELPLLLVENTVFVPCMMPTALLRDLGGYDAGQRYNYEDWEIGIRLLARGWPIITIPRYLQRYRVRQDSLFRTMSDVQNQVMRELLLTNHRETVARFAPEVAMQIEHQLMKLREEKAQESRMILAVDAFKPLARRSRAVARMFAGANKAAATFAQRFVRPSR
jgi:glycosyltransferase involved in cell wall biosynthesis